MKTLPTRQQGLAAARKYCMLSNFAQSDLEGSTTSTDYISTARIPTPVTSDYDDEQVAMAPLVLQKHGHGWPRKIVPPVEHNWHRCSKCWSASKKGSRQTMKKSGSGGWCSVFTNQCQARYGMCSRHTSSYGGLALWTRSINSSSCGLYRVVPMEMVSPGTSDTMGELMLDFSTTDIDGITQWLKDDFDSHMDELLQ